MRGVAGDPAAMGLRMLVSIRLTVSQQCAQASKRTKLHPGEHQTQHSQRVRGKILLLCSALVHPELCWATPFEKDVLVLDCVQRRPTKLMKGWLARPVRSG